MDIIIQNADTIKTILEIIVSIFTIFGCIKGWQWFTDDTVPDFKFSYGWILIYVRSLMSSFIVTIFFVVIILVKNNINFYYVFPFGVIIDTVVFNIYTYRKQLSSIINGDKDAKYESIFFCLLSDLIILLFAVSITIIVGQKFSNTENTIVNNIINCIFPLTIYFFIYFLIGVGMVTLFSSIHRRKKYSIAEITYDDGDFVKVRYTKRTKRNDMLVFERSIWNKEKETGEYYSYAVNPSKVKTIFFKLEDNTDMKGLKMKDSDLDGKESSKESVSDQAKVDSELSNTNGKKEKR